MDAHGGDGEVGAAGRLVAPREVGSTTLEAGSEVGEVVAVDPVGGCGGRSGEVAGMEGRRSGGKSRSLSRGGSRSGTRGKKRSGGIRQRSQSSSPKPPRKKARSAR